MNAKVLDGRILAVKLKAQLHKEIEGLKLRFGKSPILYAVSFLKDPSIEDYALSQQKAALSLGIDYKRVELAPKDMGEAIALLKAKFSVAKTIMFMFKPIPKGFDLDKIFERFDNFINIEGMFPNLPTPQAALALLKSSKVPLKGKTAVVLGRSDIVGKPLLHLLLQEDLTVTVCHSKTPKDKLITFTRSADIVCSCVGKPGFVKKAWIKKGAVVIDIGTNEVNGKIVGDVEEDVKKTAGFISPVPGGVGPVTSIMLMKNVVEAFKCQIS